VVECLLPKEKVAGSSPVRRSRISVKSKDYLTGKVNKNGKIHRYPVPALP
jgi:hypothetical protein